MAATEIVGSRPDLYARAQELGAWLGRVSAHAVPAYVVVAVVAVLLPEFETLRVSAAAHLPFVGGLVVAATIAGFATWQRVRRDATSESVLVFMAFAVLAGVYGPHLWLEDYAVDPGHLIFGPASRASFGLLLAAAVFGVRVPRALRSPVGALVLSGVVVLVVDVVIHGSVVQRLLETDPVTLLRSIEWLAVAAGLVVLATVLRRGRHIDGRFLGAIARSLTAMVVSSGLFLLSSPWQTRWWVAHLGLLAAAAVVTGHVARERALAGSLASVVDLDALTSVADLLVDEVDSGVALIDRHGDLVGWNRAAQELTGWNRGYAQRFFPRGQLDGVIGVGPATVRVRQMRLDRLGSPIDVTLFTDVSREVRLGVEKARLDDLTVSLERANAAKNQLLGVVAHELRNPLGAVRGFAQVLTSRGPEATDDVAGLLLQRIEASSERMLEMVDDLLSLSSLEEQALSPSLRRDELDVAAVARGVVEVHAPAAEEKGIALELEVAAADCTAVLDGSKLEQVLANLITNALKFSEAGTRVAVRVDASPGHVRATVTDQGQGIPAEEVPKLFEPFVRTSVQPTAGERSTGLGLAIVKRIVDAHGGSISVDSSVGEGTSFTVTLPRHADGLGGAVVAATGGHSAATSDDGTQAVGAGSTPELSAG